MDHSRDSVGVKCLDHIGLYVSNLDRTLHFYCDVLGFEQVERPPEFTFEGAWLRCGEDQAPQVHIFVERGSGRARETVPKMSEEELKYGFSVHFALEVENLAEVHGSLDNGDDMVVGGPYIRSDGIEQLYVVDPDGYVVELFTRHDPHEADRRRKAITEFGVPSSA